MTLELNTARTPTTSYGGEPVRDTDNPVPRGLHARVGHVDDFKQLFRLLLQSQNRCQATSYILPYQSHQISLLTLQSCPGIPLPSHHFFLSRHHLVCT